MISANNLINRIWQNTCQTGYQLMVQGGRAVNNIRAVMLVILALAIVGGTSGDTTVMLSDPRTDWPVVKPISLNVHVTSKNPKVVLDVYSDRDSSNPLYQLRC